MKSLQNSKKSVTNCNITNMTSTCHAWNRFLFVWYNLWCTFLSFTIKQWKVRKRIFNKPKSPWLELHKEVNTLQFNSTSIAISEQSLLALKSLKWKMRSIMHNNWWNHLILLYMYQEKLSKLIFAIQPTSLLLGKTQEKSDLVYYRFHNVRLDNLLDSELKPQVKLNINLIKWDLWSYR